MRRRVLAVLAVGLMAAACGVPVESEPRVLDAGAAPFGALGVEPSAPPSGRARAVVYLVEEGHLVAVTRRVPTLDDERAVLGALVAGPTRNEREAGLSSAVPDGTALEGGLPVGRVATVVVPSTAGTETVRNDEVLAFAQVVLTLSRLPGVQAVRFVRDGELLAVPRADGSLTSLPLTRRDYADLL